MALVSFSIALSIIHLITISSSQSCEAPWCYEGAYMTVCHEVVECGLVNDINSPSEKCQWYDNGVAVRPGMFNTECADCKAGTYQYCSFSVEDEGETLSVDAQICVNNEAQTCYVECGQEICLKRYDEETGKEFYKTGRTVSSCPQNHPVNNKQCCANQDWAHCTCLKRPTVDVSDEVYDALGQSNNFIDVWYGACDSEYSATDDYSIKLINAAGISGWYYAIATRPYNPNFNVTVVKAKSSNSDYYYECAQQSYDKEVWKCLTLQDAVGEMEGPISLEMYTTTGRYIIKENVMTLTANEVQLVDLYIDGEAFTEEDVDDDGSGSNVANQIAFILIGLLVMICISGIGGYWIYKRKQMKGKATFNHDDEEEDNDEDKDTKQTDGYDMKSINTNDDDDDK